MAKRYPDVATDKYHIDILTAHFVQRPDWFDVVVASNLFGDILSDLGPACTGTIGIAPSGNLNPERTFPSLFEPVHGSAPDIAGQGIAKPIGQIWSGAMMLDHLAATTRSTPKPRPPCLGDRDQCSAKVRAPATWVAPPTPSTWVRASLRHEAMRRRRVDFGGAYADAALPRLLFRPPHRW